MRHSRGRIVLAATVGGLGGAGTALLMILINRQLTGAPLTWKSAGLFAGVVAGVLATSLVSRLLMIRVMQRTEQDLRVHLSREILASPLRQLEEIGPSRLLAALTQDIAQLSATLSALPQLCVNAAMVAACLVYLAWLSLPVMVVLVVFLAITVLFNNLVDRRASRLLFTARQSFDTLMRHFSALTEGIKELKLHASRSRAFFSEQLEPTAAEVSRRNVLAFEAYAVASVWSQILFFLAIGLLVFVLPRFQPVGLPVLTSYSVAIFFLRGPVLALVDLLPSLRRAGVAQRNLKTLGLSLEGAGRAVGDLAVPATPAGCRRIDLLGVAHTYFREDEDSNFTLGPLDLTLERESSSSWWEATAAARPPLPRCSAVSTPRGRRDPGGWPRVGEEEREAYRQLFSVVFSEFFLFDSLLGLASPELDRKTREYLSLLQLDRKVRVEGGALSTLELSRGQRKRLALLTAYLEDRPFYVFDEWAADQDPVFKEIFYRQLLPDLRRRGKGVLVISHDNHYHGAADRIVRLDYGRMERDEPALPRQAHLTQLDWKETVPSALFCKTCAMPSAFF